MKLCIVFCLSFSASVLCFTETELEMIEGMIKATVKAGSISLDTCCFHTSLLDELELCKMLDNNFNYSGLHRFASETFTNNFFIKLKLLFSVHN